MDIAGAGLGLLLVPEFRPACPLSFSGDWTGSKCGKGDGLKVSHPSSRVSSGYVVGSEDDFNLGSTLSLFAAESHPIRQTVPRPCGSTPGGVENRTWGFNSPSGRGGRGRRQSTPGVDVRLAFLSTHPYFSQATLIRSRVPLA